MRDPRNPSATEKGNRRGSRFSLASIALAMVLAAGPVLAEIPGVMHCPSVYDFPVFVATELAVTDEGLVDEELLGLENATRLRDLALGLPIDRDDSLLLRPRLAEKAKSGTVTIDLRDSGLEGYFYSLEEGLQQAHTVVAGRVTHLRPGFANRRFGQMVELEIERVLKGQKEEGQSLLFFFPGGQVNLWDVTVHFQYEEPGAEPALGDQVVLFFKNHAVNQRCPFVTALPAGVLTFRDGLAAKLPRLYRGVEKAESWTLEAVLKNARKTLESQ